MSDLRCKVGWHDWSKFGEVVEAFGGLTQFRSCERCGKINYTSCYGNQASAEDINRTANQQGIDQ